jgi:large subunit ribosomal protein L13
MKAQSCTLRKPDEIQDKWYLVDAEGAILGRIAARVAKLLRGKLDPAFAPHQDPKIHVIVTNADKVVLTGNKMKDKIYYHHSTWRTGIKSISAEHLMEKKPEEILTQAIHGMLPKNTLGRKIRKHLRVYKAGEYTNQHEAQQPETLEIKTRKPKAAF